MRRRSRQTISLKDRLSAVAKEAFHKASLLPPGPEKDDLLRKARQAETASRVDWANSRNLRPPRS
jgi:hypothetical protein